MITRVLFGFLLTVGCVVRGQYYLNDGVFKFVAGMGLPIDVSLAGGSLSWFTNVQVFYKLPDNITYYEPYKVIQKRSVKNTFNKRAIHRALVNYLQRLGLSGNECLHWFICEMSRKTIFRRGLLGDIIHTVFSPEDEDHQGVKQHRNAMWQGLHNNSNCGTIYTDCFIEENSIFLS